MKALLAAIIIALSGITSPFLPNPVLTPGAINPDVTQANIHSTICVSGYTSTIRPPSSYTTALKKQQLANGYAYKGDMNTSDYEEDHLISLELGGAPSDPKNLWPEPYVGETGARVKDQIENKLHELVCSGRISLATAQRAIATNWWAAYNLYILGKQIPVDSATPEPGPSATSNLANGGGAPTAKPTQSSKTPAFIHPGAFCKSALKGKKAKAENGLVYRCKKSATDDRLRWRQ